jgi:hypothetical protein
VVVFAISLVVLIARPEGLRFDRRPRGHWDWRVVRGLNFVGKLDHKKLRAGWKVSQDDSKRDEVFR